jgi:hypothetical protein
MVVSMVLLGTVLSVQNQSESSQGTVLNETSLADGQAVIGEDAESPGTGSADPASGAEEGRPAWTALFHEDGTVRDQSGDGIADARDVFGGLDAVFVEDRISGGSFTDVTALRDDYVYNGLVSPPHDLGNAYVFAHNDGIDLSLDVRVERLVSGAEDISFVEFELNQQRVGVTQGIRSASEVRWAFRGDRSVNDLLVRVNLVGHAVSSVELMRWDDVDGYRTIDARENLDGGACVSYFPVYSICGGSLADDGAYIANAQPDLVYAPDSYIDFSMSIGGLVGLNPEYTTVQVRTPEDVALGTFKAFGYFASRALADASPRGGNIR